MGLCPLSRFSLRNTVSYCTYFPIKTTDAEIFETIDIVIEMGSGSAAGAYA
jgi:hypothetical protein